MPTQLSSVTIFMIFFVRYHKIPIKIKTFYLLLFIKINKANYLKNWGIYKANLLRISIKTRKLFVCLAYFVRFRWYLVQTFWSHQLLQRFEGKWLVTSLYCYLMNSRSRPAMLEEKNCQGVEVTTYYGQIFVFSITIFYPFGITFFTLLAYFGITISDVLALFRFDTAWRVYTVKINQKIFSNIFSKTKMDFSPKRKSFCNRMVKKQSHI